MRNQNRYRRLTCLGISAAAAWIFLTGCAVSKTAGFQAAADDFTQGNICPVPLEYLDSQPKEEQIADLGKSGDGLFHLYGYAAREEGFKGVLIADWEDNVSSFPAIVYASYRPEPPDMVWQKEARILLVSFHTQSGPEAGADELYAFARWDTGHMEPFKFEAEDCERLLKERLDYELDQAGNTITLLPD